MIVYCRNGHEQDGIVIRYNANGHERYCTTCAADLSEYVQPDDVPRWPVVLVVLGALLMVGAWWWWMWLAPV